MVMPGDNDEDVGTDIDCEERIDEHVVSSVF